MNYKLYKRSRDLAWRILLRERVCELPVDVLEICRRMGIRVREYGDELAHRGDGFSYIARGKACIYVRRGQSWQRCRFTIAHELGHILLGHVKRFELVNREPLSEDDPIEQAANGFAARLLAPVCVLWGCGVSSAAEIARLCDISMTAAGYRWERLQVLLERDKFLSSRLERKVFRRFEKYIEKNQKPL